MDYIAILTKASSSEFINITSQILGASGSFIAAYKTLSAVTKTRTKKINKKSGSEEAFNYLKMHYFIGAGTILLLCSYLAQLFLVFNSNPDIHIFIAPCLFSLFIIVVLYVLIFSLYKRRKNILNLEKSSSKSAC